MTKFNILGEKEKEVNWGGFGLFFGRGGDKKGASTMGARGGVGSAGIAEAGCFLCSIVRDARGV